MIRITYLIPGLLSKSIIEAPEGEFIVPSNGGTIGERFVDLGEAKKAVARTLEDELDLEVRRLEVKVAGLQKLKTTIDEHGDWIETFRKPQAQATLFPPSRERYT